MAKFDNTIILTVHNKASTIVEVVDALLSGISEVTNRVIILNDGSNDGTDIVLKEKYSLLKNVDIVKLDDIWEVKANNVGLRMVTTKYATIIQDDMVILEQHWDKRLGALMQSKDIFSVSGRGGLNIFVENGDSYITQFVGREAPLGDQSYIGRIAARIIRYTPVKFAVFLSRFNPDNVRQTVNRGPWMIDMEKIRFLNYLDEAFAPFELDDVDVCCRAVTNGLGHSLVSPVNYKELAGSKKTSSISSDASKAAIQKNAALLSERYTCFTKPAHSKRAFKINGH